MSRLQQWNQIKPALGLPPAVIFWVVSIACFVLGLSFENSTGITIGGVDIAILIAVSLGLANTLIQIVGNDADKETMGTMLFLGWIASYMFGVGSNVNFLYSILSIENPWVKFMICGGLGTMIEVLPEKLVVTWLKSLPVTPLRLNTPQQLTDRGIGIQSPQSYPKPNVTQNLPRKNNNYPTQHQVRVKEPEIPEFLMKRMKGNK